MRSDTAGIVQPPYPDGNFYDEVEFLRIAATSTVVQRPEMARNQRYTACHEVGMAVIPLRPAHPERICWGCPRYCSAEELGCAGGTIRTPHPIELFGDDWQEFFGETGDPASDAADPTRD